jgi:endonuclease/exonuclease/phosphatase family metal-dependent hydrolase
LLVDRSRVTVIGTPISANYATNIGVVAPGVNLVRGYVVAEVQVGEKRVTVASTHLESGSGPSLELLRAAQATELTARFAGVQPVIVLGDLNDRPGSPMYQVLAGNRLVDLWPAFRREGAGFTCCEAANLGNERPTLDQRIDYVWARGSGRTEGDIALVGNRPQDRIAGPVHPIWPSDHAGLVARVAFLEALASR